MGHLAGEAAWCDGGGTGWRRRGAAGARGRPPAGSRAAAERPSPRAPPLLAARPRPVALAALRPSSPGPGNRRSSAARRSGASFVPAAATFSTTCVGARRADDDGVDARLGEAPREREARGREARLLRERDEAIDAREHLRREPRGHEAVALRVGAAAARGRAPPAYLPVSTPCAIGLHTHWPTPSRRETGTTSASMPRSSRLYSGWLTDGAVAAEGPRDADRLGDLRPRPHGDAPVERLARAHEVLHGAHRLLERDVGVEAVALEEVDVVGAQAAQARVARLDDVLAREALVVRAPGPWARRPSWRSRGPCAGRPRARRRAPPRRAPRA